MTIPKDQCDHLRKQFQHRVAAGGWWFNLYLCPTCGHWMREADCKVDQNDQRDCEAADATQGIV